MGAEAGLAREAGFRHDLSVSRRRFAPADNRTSLIESHETGATVAISDESGRLTIYCWEVEAKPISAAGQKGTVRLTKIEAGSVSDLRLSSST
jgi:hypothetical protein